ncbi:MAG: hypothetical protein FWG00_04900 [Coriobacteriia bacterium]|jgi:hypothetical protein|nr:hypothetical protein [Coriobacteriia bacterium]MDR2713960.1 hypothetical protein [Coriobacteriales bacterium]
MKAFLNEILYAEKEVGLEFRGVTFQQKVLLVAAATAFMAASMYLIAVVS